MLSMAMMKIKKKTPPKKKMMTPIISHHLKSLKTRGERKKVKEVESLKIGNPR